jgi:hypothetical protein
MVGLPYDTEETIDKWGNMIVDPSFPLDCLVISPLSMSKDGGNSLWKSDFDLNPGKYGYQYPDTNNLAYWENTITGLNFNRAVEIANTLDITGKQNRKNLSMLFSIPGLLSMGYTFDQIKNPPPEIFDQLKIKHSDMCHDYFSKLLKRNKIDN